MTSRSALVSGVNMHGASHKPRVLCVDNDQDLAAEFDRIGVAIEGVGRMLPKARSYAIKLSNVYMSHANVMKEAFLASGGDAAIKREMMIGMADRTDVILVGSRRNFSSAAKHIAAEEVGGPVLAAEIEAAIALYEAGPIPPDESALPDPKSRRMYSEMGKRTIVMGILNVTPDSFSDGGRFLDHSAAAEHAMRMVVEGADIIDIGGESSRPGSEPVSAEEEIDRVAPVIEELADRTDKPISIDTYKSKTAEAALDAGANIVNDISGMSFDPEMRGLVAERRCPIIVMHIKGAPKDMQKAPEYSDLMGEVTEYLRQCILDAAKAGIDERMVIIDPGIGFGKTVDHNLEIIRRLCELKSLGRPILMGTSRKSTIGQVLGGLTPEERLEGTAATVALSIARGANIVRVHDVKEMARVTRMTDAILRGVPAPVPTRL